MAVVGGDAPPPILVSALSARTATSVSGIVSDAARGSIRARCHASFQSAFERSDSASPADLGPYSYITRTIRLDATAAPSRREAKPLLQCGPRRDHGGGFASYLLRPEYTRNTEEYKGVSNQLALLMSPPPPIPHERFPGRPRSFSALFFRNPAEGSIVAVLQRGPAA